MRSIVPLALLLALVAIPLASAETGDDEETLVEGPRGACISQRGTTGIAITLAHCLPNWELPGEPLR